MTSVFRDSSAAWAGLIIVVLPLLIIGVGELQERLRQRDSSFQASVAIARVWVLPLLTVWVLSQVLFDLGFGHIVVRVLGTGLLISSAVVALSALRAIVAELADRPRRSGQRAIPRLLLALPRLLLVIASAWILVAGVWGVDLSAALTALGVTSLVISFALQDTLSGIASGFTLLADQPFAPGDWIESDDVAGRVIDINWRSTRIETRDGDLLVVPNGQLANATITNYNQPSRLHRIKMPVQIDRTAPPTAAIEMLVDAARSTPGVVEEPPPFAVVTQIADPVVDYDAFMWIDDYANAPRVMADFGALVWYLSYRHGVPLPNPAQDLFLFDGEKAAIDSRVTTADIRRKIADMPVAAQLDDDVLDRLGAAASIDQYKQGETIAEEGTEHGMRLLREGHARLVLRQDGLEDLVVLDLEVGEILTVLVDPPATRRASLIVAVTDCEVITIHEEAVAHTLTLAPEVNAVLEQLAVTRRRRIQRILRRVQPAGAETGSSSGGSTPSEKS